MVCIFIQYMTTVAREALYKRAGILELRNQLKKGGRSSRYIFENIFISSCRRAMIEIINTWYTHEQLSQ